MVACAVGGMAIFIAAIAMIVGGLTVGSAYPTSAPPNLAALGGPQIMGGLGLLILGGGLAGSAAALLAGARFARPAAIALSGLTTLLAAVGAALLVVAPARDTVLIAALVVVLVAFGSATIVLARSTR